MTGGLLAPLPLPSPFLTNQATSSYSVDSFSEYSTRTVNHASSPTSVPRSKEDDEELFRDLFATENDVENNESYKVVAQRFIPQKPATGRISSHPGNRNPRQLAPMKSVRHQSPLPTPLIPRLKLEELMNTRPDDDFEVADDNNSRRTYRRGSLKQVAEEDDQELQFLEKLDLKAVLHTPRPDLLSFYPKTPTARMGSPQSNISGYPADDHFIENHAKDKVDGAKNVPKDPVKVSRTDVNVRLAYMESMYGTAPIARKTRRGTIDRLANPISGHSSTLQALSPKQRKKREAALTTRVPLNPVSAAIAVTCRRSTTTKKTKKSQTLHDEFNKCVGDYKTPVPTTKQKINKRPDPLVPKRRSNATNSHGDSQVPSTRGFSTRKNKTTMGSHSIDARKEALKKNLQSRAIPTKRGKIGGSTFLTQRDDEDGVELIEDFIARNRGVAQVPLTFRSGVNRCSRNVIPAVPTKTATTARSRPRPNQPSTRATFTRASSASTSKNGLSRAYASSNHGKPYRDPARLFQQPRRPQAWQTSQNVGANTRSFTERPPSATNPLRKLKVQPVTGTLLSRAPKASSSAATTVLMGSEPLFSLSGAPSAVKSARAPNRKKTSRRKPDRTATFAAPTKSSDQRKRSSTIGEKVSIHHKTVARRSTSRV